MPSFENLTAQANESSYTTVNVKVDSNAFSTVEEYQIRFNHICEENNISREGNREIVDLINEMSSNPLLRK